MGIETAFGNNIITTKLSEAVNWARKYSLFPYMFPTACCGIEFMSILGPPYDTGRFGNEAFRFSPRQADLLVVIGTINNKMAPILKRIYDQMCEPKWVIAFGACASSGGFYNNYSVVQGVDKFLPVDVYLGGCPPRPEQYLDALIKIQNKIDKESVLEYK